MFLLVVYHPKRLKNGNARARDHACGMRNAVFWDVTPCGSCHGVTSQKTTFFIVTAVKTSNLT
jgi:hypothetical protein